RGHDVGILIERLEGVAHAVFQIPRLRREVLDVRLLAAEKVDEAIRRILFLGLRTDAVQPRPPHRTLAGILHAGEARHLNVAGALAERGIVHAREDVPYRRCEYGLSADVRIAHLRL